jgi:multidrug efflux pump subunit AcrB
MALTVATGFIVDDAIVVVEAISHRLAQGEAPFAAARAAAHQIGFTVVSISVSLIAVFIPLLLMGGVIGRLFREFSVTLAVAIAVSAVVSLTLIPVMGAYLAPATPSNPRAHWSDLLFARLLRGYEAGLRVALRHRGLTLLVAIATVAANVLLYVHVPKGFFPQQDTGTIMAIAEAPATISFQAMSERTRELVRAVLQDPAVEHAGSFVGGGSMNQARIFISLKPPSQRPDIDRVIARLRGATQHVAGIRLFMVPVQDLRAGGRSAKSQYQYTLQGSKLVELEQAAEKLADALRASPDLRDVTTDLEKGALQSNLVIDRDAASRLGIAAQDIDQALYDAFGQRPVSKIYDAHYTYHVVLEADPALQQDPSSLAKIYVPSKDGSQVPLAALMRVEHGLKPSTVAHQGQFPAVTLSFSMRPGAPLERGTEIVQQAMGELQMPADIRGSFQGNARVFAQSLANQPLLIAAALAAVYIVLGVLYESTIHPLTILSTLPSAGIGAILALWAAGRPLDLIGLIAIILLIGIVKKNAIMMIDYALAAEREHGLTPEQSIAEACRLRFRPILMTTLTAILGAVPLAVGAGVGAELRQPLGIAVVGGLIVSQLLTLFTTPAVYLALDRFRPQSGRRRIGLDAVAVKP